MITVNVSRTCHVVLLNLHITTNEEETIACLARWHSTCDYVMFSNRSRARCRFDLHSRCFLCLFVVSFPFPYLWIVCVCVFFLCLPLFFFSVQHCKCLSSERVALMFVMLVMLVVYRAPRLG